ncbi:MAG: hypothetical protein E7326_02925 [Clostridiales bacterium]|nr:hypothetical protein [Clostridiales bacterium]
MGQLIDLCGTPIQLDKIKDFRLVKREWIFYPAYQEVEEQSFSLFARKGEKNKKKFVFTKMVPFGAVLNDKEKPSAGSYEIKSFGEAVTLSILPDIISSIGKTATLVSDFLRIDTSGLKEYHLLTVGRRLTSMRLRDIPAKVAFLSGKVSDVYKNDQIYAYLGEPISPTIVAVPTLVVNVEKKTYVFFGGGIDMEDAEAAYRFLFEEHKHFLEIQEKEKEQANKPKVNVNLPKLSIPTIKIQSPFVFTKKGNDTRDEKTEKENISDAQNDDSLS